ncbi:hypothetical protein ACFVS2_21380 [Brevibacillus sp. NPDC058079]|uniref:hypothetical protein n=1 Tax=Brevibacillus sp. NPDC058079 TaxID=3346330 RepID=UPI0036E8940E
MKVKELLASISFATVMKELLLTSPFYKKRLTEFFVYLQEIKKTKSKSSLETTLIIDEDSYQRCYLVDGHNRSILNEGITYLAVGDYLDARIGEWELKNLSPGLIVAALLVTLTEEGTCFSEADRMQFARKLYWHSYELNIAISMSE